MRETCFILFQFCLHRAQVVSGVARTWSLWGQIIETEIIGFKYIGIEEMQYKIIKFYLKFSV